MKIAFLYFLSFCFMGSCVSDAGKIDHVRGSVWVSNPNKLGRVDTLKIDSNNYARYYLHEVGWCESTYLPFSDTLILLTVAKWIEVNRKDLEPDVSSFFVYGKNRDTLKLVKMQHKVNGSFIKDLSFEPYYFIRK